MVTPKHSIIYTPLKKERVCKIQQFCPNAAQIGQIRFPSGFFPHGPCSSQPAIKENHLEECPFSRMELCRWEICKYKSSEEQGKGKAEPLECHPQLSGMRLSNQKMK